MEKPHPTIFTIGHSTLPVGEFLSLLKENGIETLADIRSFPGSRKFPQFGQESLREHLASVGVEYAWYKDLGGFRKKALGRESHNTALISPGFRNYADYMETESFRTAAAELMQRSEKTRTAVMCAEKLFWRCHRRLLSDYLVSRGIEVVHILDPGKTQVHTLSKDAVKTEEGVIYPLV